MSASPRIALASVVAIAKNGPNPPGLDLSATTVKVGAGVGLTVWPDGAGHLSVVVTNPDDDLLVMIVWNRPVTGRTVLRWDGRIGSKPAPPGTYEIRAFTVDGAALASDPTRTTITVR